MISAQAKYIELADYRTTCFSLLFAAAVCFSLNSYKMTLDVTKRTPFLAFKAILVVQVGTIVYTRVILWFPTCARMLAHFADAGDTMYYRGGLCAAGLMTLFNLAILNDAVVTFAKWIPKPLPEPTTRADNQKLFRELSRSSSLGSALSLSGRSGRDRFRAAARRVIAEKRLSTVDSDPSGSRKED